LKYEEIELFQNQVSQPRLPDHGKEVRTPR